MFETVAIIGVGLIGGSFARAIRSAGFTGRILGVSSTATLREALELGVIDEGVELQEAALRADLIYLAQPIRVILRTLPLLANCVRPDALITDAGSTKARIVAEASASLPRTRFLGGHPMAGKESRGVGAADPDLFRGRAYLLTPESPEQMQTGGVKEFLQLLEGIGAKVYVVSAETHDRLVAFTSHLPQLASTALGATLAGSLTPEELSASGPGLRDMTRLAMSSYEIWSDILASNQTAIEKVLESYIAVLQEMRRNLLGNPTSEAFRNAKEFSRHLRQSM